MYRYYEPNGNTVGLVSAVAMRSSCVGLALGRGVWRLLLPVHSQVSCPSTMLQRVETELACADELPAGNIFVTGLLPHLEEVCARELG